MDFKINSWQRLDLIAKTVSALYFRIEYSIVDSYIFVSQNKNENIIGWIRIDYINIFLFCFSYQYSP